MSVIQRDSPKFYMLSSLPTVRKKLTSKLLRQQNFLNLMMNHALANFLRKRVKGHHFFKEHTFENITERRKFQFGGCQ